MAEAKTEAKDGLSAADGSKGEEEAVVSPLVWFACLLDFFSSSLLVYLFVFCLFVSERRVE